MPWLGTKWPTDQYRSVGQVLAITSVVDGLNAVDFQLNNVVEMKIYEQLQFIFFTCLCRSCPNIWKLPEDQKDVDQVPSNTKKVNHVSPFLQTLQCLSVWNRIDFSTAVGLVNHTQLILCYVMTCRNHRASGTGLFLDSGVKPNTKWQV